MDSQPKDRPEPARAPTAADDSRRRALVALVLLTAAFIVGASVARDPDFDVTFGIEAWRRFGPVPAAICAALVGVVMFDRRVADAVAAGAAAVVDRIPSRGRVPLLLAAALALFVLFEDVSLSGDSTASICDTILGNVQPSNALTTWLFFASARVFGPLGLDPVVCVRAVSWAAGLVGVVCGVALARTLFDDASRRTAAAFLLLTTGSAALFFGSIEFYAPLGAVVIAYLLVSVRAMRGVGSAALPPLVLGVAFALHGSAGLLLVSLVVLAWDPFGSDRRDLRGAVRRVAVAGALFLVPVVATVAGLYFWTWRGVLPPADEHRWGNFLGAMGHGPLLAPRLGPTDVGPRYALFDAEHALAVLTTIFVAAPAAWALLTSGLAVRGPRPAPESAPDRRLACFAVAALIPWVVYPCVWNVSYSLRRDWDMFTPLGTFAAFAAAVFLLRRRDDRATAVSVASLCLYAFAPFVASHAGDVADRRTFASNVAAAMDRPRIPGQDAVREAWVRRWKDESRRLDATGAMALIDEGDALTNWGRLAEAAAKYDEALRLEPDNAAATYCRGSRLLRLGRRDEARRDLLASLRLALTNENVRLLARHDLGRLAFAEGDANEAVRQLTRAVRECSYVAESLPAAHDLAVAWRSLGRSDVAAEIDRWAEERARR